MHPETLPPDWRMVTFGELAFHIADRVDDPKRAGVDTYVGLEHLDPGSLRIKRWGTPEDVEATKLRVKPGQIIFGKRRAYQRKVAISHFDGICSAHAMVLEANLETTVPGFLGFFMQSDLFFDAALAISEGSLSPTIKWKTLAVQQFPLPPLSRQHEMVELFQAIEEAIAATEESLAAAEELKRALLRELLTRGIGHTAFKQTEIGLVPVEWEVRSLSDICERLTDGTHQPPKKTPDGTIPFLYVSCVRDGRISWDQADKITEETYRNISRGREPQPGLILYTIVGSYGHPALVTTNEPFSFQRHIGYILPDKNIITPEFLVNWLDGPWCRSYADIVAVGNAQKTITLGSLGSYQVPIPSVSEQLNIVQLLADANEQLTTLRTHKTHLQTLKSRIINRLLTGQHDGDEQKTAEMSRRTAA